MSSRAAMVRRWRERAAAQEAGKEIVRRLRQRDGRQDKDVEAEPEQQDLFSARSRKDAP